MRHEFDEKQAASHREILRKRPEKS